MNSDKVYKDEYGHELVADKQGLLTNLYGQKFMVGKDGQLHELKSPLDASTIYLNENGEYVSDYSDTKFHVNENGVVIPLEDPITHNGTAHIENGQLVSDVTGERYDIDNNGYVLTPEEIANQQRAEELNNRIAEMEANGEIDRWLEERDIDNKESLSEEELKAILEEDEEAKSDDEIIDEIISEGIEEGITSEELSNANREINQAQREFVAQELGDSQPNIDEDMVIGG